MKNEVFTVDEETKTITIHLPNYEAVEVVTPEGKGVYFKPIRVEDSESGN